MPFFPVPKGVWQKASGNVVTLGSLSEWKLSNSKSGFPLRCVFWLSERSKQWPHLMRPPHQQSQSTALMEGGTTECVYSTDKEKSLFSFSGNSPEKPDTMADILKWFSSVTGKSPREVSLTSMADLLGKRVVFMSLFFPLAPSFAHASSSLKYFSSCPHSQIRASITIRLKLRMI